MKSLQTRTLLNRTLRGGGEPGGNHAEQNWAGVLGVVVALLERFAVGAGETEEATQVADQATRTGAAVASSTRTTTPTSA